MATKKKYRATLYSEAWMRGKYLDEALTATEIGGLVGCPTSTVLRALRVLGFAVRHESKQPEVRACPNAADPKCKKEFQVGGRGGRARSAVYCSRHCHMKQQPRGGASNAPRPRKNVDTLHNEAWLRERYVDKRMSAGEIAILCNCTTQSVRHALDKFNIPLRSASEANFGKTFQRGDRPFDTATSAGRKQWREAEARRAAKREMVDVYGGECACCGEKEIAFLCLDHPDGGGLAERTEAGGSAALMRKLKKDGWPKGYRILCANCNLATKYGRTCPHQAKKG